MPKVLVCQHVGYEILGTLNPLLKKNRIRIRYVNFYRDHHATPTLNGYDGLILLGGPMNVDETSRYPFLAYELKLIREAIALDIPVLGICLGAQLIAKALGAAVMKNPVEEIGWYDVQVTEGGKSDPVFQHFSATEKILQWHGDAFSLPPGCVHLASSSDCAHQAIRYGTKVYGFQFHLEADEAMLHRWIRLGKERGEFSKLRRTVNPDHIEADTSQYIERTLVLGKKTFGEFLKLF